MNSQLDLSLVIDIGKSNAKLLLLDANGNVVESHSRANASVTSALGYPALDVLGLQQWMQDTLRSSSNAKRCGHVIASTHGASLVALGEQGLAWEPLDYEFDVSLQGTAAALAFKHASGSFKETLSPDLPAGLNAARQLYWLQNTQPEAWRETRTLLPYPQYWAWLLSGVAASEVSSLGCHTHLWNPNTASYSSLAIHQGWAARFAPLRSAWDVLGTVGAERGIAWGLPADCQVHVGVHDSNACLARYIAAPGATTGAASGGASTPDSTSTALTIVSSGTWTVLMAPGASAAALHAEQGMLANVDVTGRLTPTARFMGGREFEALLDGASPKAASLNDVQALIDTGCYAVPAFAAQGGPFAGHVGYVQYQGQRTSTSALSEPQRAALAALYCAQMTTWLLQHLWQNTVATHRVVVEGPLSHNANYLSALQALLPGAQVAASVDAVEGTAKGAWRLAQGFGEQAQAMLQVQEMSSLTGMAAYHTDWLKQLPDIKI